MKKFLLSVALAALATVSTSAESTTLIFDFTNPGAPRPTPTHGNTIKV